MILQDYTTEELRAELKRRTDLVKAEKAKVKRCSMCIHWGEVDYFGISDFFAPSTSCRFHKTKDGKHYLHHAPSQRACEHFEQI